MTHSNLNHYETIRVEDVDNVRTITLHRPEWRNALTQVMIRELTKVLVQTTESHTLRVLILTGAGDGFCSGLDLSELQKISSQSEEEQRSDSWFLANLFRLLYDCPKPTIAAVQALQSQAVWVSRRSAISRWHPRTRALAIPRSR